jgi:hypothetical protein
MKISFSTPAIVSIFKVGDRVRVDIQPLYKKPPYQIIEGTVYQVRSDFPLLATNDPNFVYNLDTIKFKYGILADARRFPQMKDLENKLYDVPEDYLMAIET